MDYKRKPYIRPLCGRESALYEDDKNLLQFTPVWVAKSSAFVTARAGTVHRHIYVLKKSTG